jgi:formylmethanofuran dehydrogenase subunit E-like metal-binding protein
MLLLNDLLLVGGQTKGTLVGVPSGSSDGVFLRALGAVDGKHEWTRQWNTSGASEVSAVVAGTGGRAFVVGDTTGNFRDPNDQKARSQLFVLNVVP